MLVDAVVRAIEKYLNGHSSRSLSSLARRSGVSYATIRRLMQHDVAQPSIENTVIPILSVFMSSKDVADLIAEYGNSSLISVWDENRTFQQSHSIDWENVDHRILLEARRSQGVSFESICIRYGKLIGAPRLSYLLENGFLRLENGNYFISNEFEVDPSPKSSLHKIQAVAKNFDTSHLGEGAFFDYFSGSIPGDSMDIVRGAAKDFIEVLEQEGGKDTSPDDEIMISVGLIADFLDDEDT
ncbi:hypothetical protein [Pseudobacteriovorax antillogorgiicola]|uniref:Uncharacterized protein n=1 Tax=Pseudobacteriovorax antillogorgiicola TaxID=1513793 RepID=A0A1Y6C3D6_9BACT|nr:hypothetical protein [Pseudobacteriovorax antillogorgiicola]TCS50750.1 hypothetical protein EDD56_112133 [Pseudobacteriovorax antillogorgiicola]SMF41083.1 hypothetical protein SAMN06296036_112132 [Pseudobacteriovorax antillogorgiicola]